MGYKLNLRKRILLGYLMPLVLMIGTCVAVYWSMKTFQQISHSVEQAHRIVENSKDLHGAVAEAQRATRGYLLLKNDRSRQDYLAAVALYREKAKLLETLVSNSTQVESLRRISEAVDRLAARMSTLNNLVDTGKTPEALKVFRSGETIELGIQIDAMTDEFEEREAAILAGKIQEQDDAMGQMIAIVVATTALAVLLAVVFGLWIAARISKAVSEAVAGMSSSSTEIAATVEEHERVVTQQAAAVNETTTTVEELGASARQTETQADSAAASAKQALEAAREGTALADQASRSMAEMKRKVGSVAEQILRLSEQAGQIGGIARVVGELASETNMLALNAAVEAARAGEQGKGFAVVASEVRKLSNQSKQSAERANALVAEIQKATNSAVMVTEEGSRTAEEVAAMTQKTVEAFESIAAAANSVSENSQRALLNSRQQANALGQVTDAMKSLSAGSRQMAAGTEQTRVGVQKLNGIALDLKAMV